MTPLRADEQDEWAGMDSSEAGERGYIMADESAFGPAPRPAAARAPARARAAAATPTRRRPRAAAAAPPTPAPVRRGGLLASSRARLAAA